MSRDVAVTSSKKRHDAPPLNFVAPKRGVADLISELVVVLASYTRTIIYTHHHIRASSYKRTIIYAHHHIHAPAGFVSAEG